MPLYDEPIVFQQSPVTVSPHRVQSPVPVLPGVVQVAGVPLRARCPSGPTLSPQSVHSCSVVQMLPASKVWVCVVSPPPESPPQEAKENNKKKREKIAKLIAVLVFVVFTKYSLKI